MTIREKAASALAGLKCGTATQVLSVQEGGQSLVCELAALDSLGCAFTRLALSSDKLAAATMSRLKSVAETLSRKLTYLLEPISPIEADAEQCTVQLRSSPPQKEGDRASYYELLVKRGGEISLCRFTRPQGQPRQVVPAQVTREVLLRLVGDFSSVA